MTKDETLQPDETPLWRHALAVYARPGVADACLHLQDGQGADVCLLLALLWAGAAGGRTLDARDLDRLTAETGSWQREVVRPLRAVRRRLKEGPPPAPDAATEVLRTRLKAVEIEAERLELERLHRLLGMVPAPDAPESVRRAAARANLTAYLDRLGARGNASEDASILVTAGLDAARSA